MRVAWAVLFFSACDLDLASRLDGRVGPVRARECVRVTGGDAEPRADDVGWLIDFGEVESAVQRDVSLFNPTDTQRVLRVEPLSPPFFFSSFITVEPRSSLVQPLLFAPSDGLLHLDTLVLTEGDCTSRVSLRGLGAGRLTSDPVVDFGSVLPGQEASRDLVIHSSRRVPVTLSLDTISDGFRVSPTTVVVPAQGEAKLTVTVASRSTLGPLMGLVLFDADVGPQVGASLFARSEGSIALVSAPLRPAVAGLWPGASTPGFLERTVEFMSTVDPAQPRPAHIIGVSYSADAGSTSELTVTLGPELLAGLAPGEHGTAMLRFEPFSLGPHAYHVQFLVAGPGEPPLDVTFTVDVSALPDCEVVAAPADQLELTSFGGLFGGSVFFTNTSHRTCVLDDVAVDHGSLAFAPGAFEQVSLLPGEQREVQVLAFVDAGTSLDAGTLRYHVLAADQPVRRVGLITVP